MSRCEVAESLHVDHLTPGLEPNHSSPPDLRPSRRAFTAVEQIQSDKGQGSRLPHASTCDSFPTQQQASCKGLP